MFRFLKCRFDKRRKKRFKSNLKFRQSEVENSISLLLDKNLTDDIECHVFEVSPSILDYVLEVIDKPPLIDEFEIQQIEKYLFMAKRRVVDIIDY